MKAKKTLLAGFAAAVMLTAGSANAALDFTFNWGATGEGFIGAPLSNTVDELKFTAESVIVFDGTPFTAGTNFTDYVTLRIDQLFNDGNNAATLANPYGDLFSMEITVLAELTGTQIDATNYIVNGVNSFRLLYDGPLNGFTAADFGNLATFADGAYVETASYVSGTGTNSTLAPDGVLDLFVGLLDLLLDTDFEVDTQGQPFGAHLLGITNSNNALCDVGLQTCAATPASILDLFGVNIAEVDNFFHTRSDGSIEKVQAVPEPGVLGLLGLAIAALGFVTSRKRAQV